jgi:uncharacterized protein (TIGR00251 family)
MTRPWVALADGVMVSVRLTPKSGRDAVDGIAVRADGTCVLQMRVRAAPSEGEANAALIKLLAATLGVPARRISLAAGAKGRVKRLKIEGDGAALTAALQHMTASREADNGAE